MSANFKQLGDIDLILDGNNYMFRNFDYSGKESLHTSDGKPIGAVFRTMKQILGLYGIFKVRSITVVLDNIHSNKSTIRHLLFPLYKATRSEKPPEIIPQFEYLKELLEAVDIQFIEAPDFYEGDDVIGTLAYNFTENKKRNIVMSSDHDMMQLVSDYTAYYCLSNKKDTADTLYTAKLSKPEDNILSIGNEFGVHPLQFADIKGLTGDTSDNIPGVTGVGKKTAIPLIQQYKTLEGLYDNLHEIIKDNKDLKNTLFTEKLVEKLIRDENIAFLSKELATIHRNIKVNIQPKRGNFKSDNAYNAFKKYEFNDLLRALFVE